MKEEEKKTSWVAMPETRKIDQGSDTWIKSSLWVQLNKIIMIEK